MYWQKLWGVKQVSSVSLLYGHKTNKRYIKEFLYALEAHKQ